MGRTQFEINPQMPRHLGLIGVRMKWQCEVRLQILYRYGLVIFDLKALGPIRRNGHNTRAEDGAALGFLRSTLAHLQESGVNRLLFELRVDFFGAFAFEYDRWN